MSRRIIISILVATGAGVLVLIIDVGRHPIPVVLMFHSVAEEPQAFDVTPAHFESLLHSADVTERSVVATTDSSDRSVYEAFAPEVQKHGFTGIVFLLPPLVGRDGMLTWDQVRELAQAGLTIGSHTLTHPWLPDLSDEELWCELCGSKRKIETEIGQAITLLAYPYGAFTDRVKRIARQCGYTAGYSTAPGRRIPDDDPWAIKRVTITDSTVQNPVLRRLALSGYWVTARETLLAFVPVEVPRKPQDWSYEEWQRTMRVREHGRFCAVSP